ncbi:MAG: hypothetical protein EOM11_09970 [Erysipelotrichia bacterium]|nr:hypothetical protein [Erysipelotrichia bacterium]
MCDRIYMFLDAFGDSIDYNSDLIALSLRMKHQTVTARLNDLLYKYQLVKVKKVVNNKAIYCTRKPYDPLNVRPLSFADRWFMLKTHLQEEIDLNTMMQSHHRNIALQIILNKLIEIESK